MNNKADLLFEIGTEELPPKTLELLSSSLLEGFIDGLTHQGLHFNEVQPFATPRRLSLFIKGLDLTQADKTVERRGPAIQVAYDQSGQPTQAALGFARSCNIDVVDVIRISTEQGEWIGHSFSKKGASTIDLLPQIAEHALTILPIPKRMRWGDETYQFVRPVHWILFLLGHQIVPFSMYGKSSSKYTYGHRFHSPDLIEISNPSIYEKTLMDSGYVIPSFNLRKELISNQIQAIARKYEAQIDRDHDLLSEVTSLTEWPVAIEGSFDKDFLSVPKEALVLTMKNNQKYFPLFDINGNLINTFITIANIENLNNDLIRRGNERVIRPRFSDAKFFWDQDAKTPLISLLSRLQTVLYQKDLGSMYDKTLRVRDLSLWLGEKLELDLEALERSSLLSRCDLLTQMVFEFPEMQGYMGKYQALRDGESDTVAEALFDFYLPRHSGDQLPRTAVGKCLALAERIDTVCGIFASGFTPSGDKDPYGLRRATIGFLRILGDSNFDLDFENIISFSLSKQPKLTNSDKLLNSILDFILDRLKNIYIEKGVTSSLVNAVYASAPKSHIEINMKIDALSKFIKNDHAPALIEINKRLNNLLKKSSKGQNLIINPELCLESEEKALLVKIDAISPQINQLSKLHRYEECLDLLISIKPAVDSFFDEIMVMTDQLELRNNRLALLKSLKDQFILIADFSYL